MQTDLSKSTFIVTGGTQGLGECTASLLAARGAAGITLCGRTAAQGEAVAARLSEQGTDARFVQADLSTIEDCHRVVDSHADVFGSLHGLANVAASTARGTIDDTTPEAWDAMMDLNLRAPFLLIQRALPLLEKAGGGSIVNISSVSAHGGQPKLTAYCTSKGALNVLTKNVAHAVRARKIRVNALNIGWMATPAEHAVQKAEGAPEDWLARADARMPLGQILRPEEVAEMILYLFSDAAARITGSVIDFDQNVIGAFE